MLAAFKPSAYLCGNLVQMMALPNLHFHSHGKLLLTGEYAVLDGALALALPTKPGQSLTAQAVEEKKEARIEWRSYDADGTRWFEGDYSLPQGQMLRADDEETGRRLEQILGAALKQRPELWSEAYTWKVKTQLEFPRKWGLGTSSTLLANLAQWLQLNPYELLRDTFGGSGYDLACALATTPILYQLRPGDAPEVNPVDFYPAYASQLYFVYLGHKQNSREGIQRYRVLANEKDQLAQALTRLTKAVLASETLADFEEAIIAHENLISKALQLPRAQHLYFNDYWGAVKSLGAWGGDFVLATSQRTPQQTKEYFNTKGFELVLPYKELIPLQQS